MTDAETGLDTNAGYTDVDAHPDTSRLVAGMEATARWEAVRQLRAWEHERFALTPGGRVLDVGCGLGDVAASLAAEVGPEGQVVGVDASDAMLEVARRRAAGVPNISFHVADALSLEEPDASFDVVRSERMLQWVPDLDAAVAEMVRVLRPGGRLALIDTDWRTMTTDLGDDEAERAVMLAHAALRERPGRAGSALLNLCRAHGLVDVEGTAAAHVWTHWDPDADSLLEGLFPLSLLRTQLVEAGAIDPVLGDRFVAAAEAAGRADRLCLSVTMFAASGRKP